MTRKGEKVIEKISLFMLTLILAFSTLANIPSASSQQGPRSDDLTINFYSNVPAAYAALRADDIDLLAYTGWSVGLPLHDGEQFHRDLYEDAINNSDIQLAPYMGNDIVGYDFNNNYTIQTYPSIRSPMSYPSFRQALAFLVDKDYIIDVIKEGFACKIDVPIPCTQSGWWNPIVTGPNYPYPYNPVTATVYFDADGFVQGTTPNPYYDPSFPGSAPHIRTYPADHSKAGQDLDPIIFYSRVNDLARLQVARLLADNMRKLGAPVNLIELDKHDLYDPVMGMRDYHIYTSGWVAKKYPIYLYKLHHCDFWCPYGANYVTGLNDTGRCNYPRLDDELDQMWYNETYAGSVDACKRAQKIMVNECISVWLYSSKGYCAYRNLLGVVNMDGYGPVNKYTFLNAYKPDGSAIRVGLVNAPMSLNVLYSSWIYEWLCLDRIYTHLLNEAPYDITIDQPWVAKDWLVDTWIDCQDNRTKTKVTYWLRQDVYWVRPVTGAVDYQLTAHDAEFSIWFTHAYNNSWPYDVVKSVHHTRIVDNFTIEVYFDSLSYWAYYWIGKQLPLMPKYLWLDNFCEAKEATMILDRDYMACEKFPFTEDPVVQTINATLDDIYLEEGLHYNIVSHKKFIFRLLAVEGYVTDGVTGAQKSIRCGQRLINTLRKYRNWQWLEWCLGGRNLEYYLNYIHLLTECDEADLGNLTGLYGGRANASNVRDRIQGFLSEPADVRVFYYRGHGGNDDGNYYMALPDGRIFDSELNTLLPDCTVVILDSCYSGQACGNIGGTRDVLAACTALQHALGHCGDHTNCSWNNWGWYTGQANTKYKNGTTCPLGIVGGLSGFNADIHNDGWIKSYEVSIFAQRTTPAYASQEGESQHPMRRICPACPLVTDCTRPFPGCLKCLPRLSCHNWFQWRIPVYQSQNLTVHYWTPHNSPSPTGYTPGDPFYPWWTFDKLEGCGMYYVTAHTPGPGGSLTLKRNPHFFLETPPLGEIDWMWTWVGTTKPRNGYFQINLYDAITLLKAYGSRGDGVPSPNWFPGADIDAIDPCHVGLYDAVTLLSKYGTKWGTLP